MTKNFHWHMSGHFRDLPSAVFDYRADSFLCDDPNPIAERNQKNTPAGSNLAFDDRGIIGHRVVQRIKGQRPAPIMVRSLRHALPASREDKHPLGPPVSASATTWFMSCATLRRRVLNVETGSTRRERPHVVFPLFRISRTPTKRGTLNVAQAPLPALVVHHAAIEAFPPAAGHSGKFPYLGEA